MKNKDIDGGKEFDWGRTSEAYAKYRDIYPDEFYKKIVSRGLCVRGQSVLDLGTGTGVLPRNMYLYGASWTGVDISPEQIAMARKMAEAKQMNINFIVCPAEDIEFERKSFDVVTACQCFWYFDEQRLIPKLEQILKSGGRLLVLYMAWLPHEDDIAAASEALVLKYNPGWSGANERMHPIEAGKRTLDSFKVVYSDEWKLDLPFTRESWHGRMKACRGVGASLSDSEIAAWEREHLALLERIAPERFTVRHYAALCELALKN